MLIEGIGADWEDIIESYAYHFAKKTGVPQVVWYVDGEPYEVVDWPYTTRWPIEPGPHRFQVGLPWMPQRSEVVGVVGE